MRPIVIHARTGLGLAAVIAAVASLGCTTDFDAIRARVRGDAGTRVDAGGSRGMRPSTPPQPGSSAAEPRDAGSDGARSTADGSTEASVPADAAPADDDGGPAVSCTAGDLRCDVSRLQACATTGDGWIDEIDCGAASCNPVALACHACAAPLKADGALACAGAVAAPAGTEVARIDTSRFSDAYSHSCGGAGSPDRVIEWTAPSAGFWVLDTAGSSYDTVLALRDCACDGSEIACNDDATQGRADSEIVARFARGQRVAVIIDGKGGAQGNAVLNANPVTCPELDLDLTALPRTIVDVDGDGKEAVRFTPESSGFYSLRVKGASNVRACLRSGPRCGGPELGCNDASDGYGAQIVRELVAGKPMTLEVAVGSNPSFELSIAKLAGARCQDLSTLDATPPAPANGTLSDASPNLLSASCAPAGIINPNDSSEVPAPEARFILSMSANVDAPTVFVVDLSSASPFTAYLLRDGCGGPEIQCLVAGYVAADSQYQTGLDVPGTGEDRDYVVVVERGSTIPPVSPFKFSYQIRVLQ